MLRVQVFGKGLIPRGLGIAPRIEPFPADLTLIATILNTNGLTMKYVNPETGRAEDLTKANVKRIYQKWSDYVPKRKDEDNNTDQTAPVVPETKFNNAYSREYSPVSITKEDIKLNEEPKETKAESAASVPQEAKNENSEAVKDNTEHRREVKPVFDDNKSYKNNHNGNNKNK